MRKKPKSKNFYVISIVAEENTHKRLEAIAEAESRSKSTMGRILIEEALEMRLKGMAVEKALAAGAVPYDAP